MLLAIIVGNTTTRFGIFDGEKLKVTWRWATDIHRMADEYAALLLNLFQYNGLKMSDIKDVVLGSVVPPINPRLMRLSENYFHASPLMIEAGVKTGVRIRVDNPKEVGADRIVNTAAIRHLYGGPAIVVDMGTATTFDVVSREGDYIGGVIAPGINIAAEALFTHTAKLPRVELAHPKSAIGTNTVAAMQSGLVFGFAGLIEGIVSRIWRELGEKTRVVATGGDAPMIAKETSIIDIVNPDLGLMGLRIIYCMNRGGEKAKDA